MSSDNSGPADANVELADKTYPQIAQKALVYRFGCLGGTAIRSIIMIFALAIPAKVALAIVGESTAWPRTILGISVFCVLSSLMFAGAARVVDSVETESLGFGCYLEQNPRVRNLPHEARVVFMHAGGTKQMIEFLVHQRPFHKEARPLQTMFKGNHNLTQARRGAKALAAAQLITFDNDSLTLTDQGVAVFADAWEEARRHSRVMNLSNLAR